ncbi:BlaR1 peptidase M56 [Mucilaginibacter pineti]|uniref:BlaR1 peptidase M56 n=1 Tax=Mucilaginibacter pineti TaxID=1391627 RepID=A0A1G7HYQ6_9SPHI|nr:M56 family metallopeptidase [Mucilaginibacter pineti]SDF05580.1 BlaR1 peptidase M56 [Mucilaginibacter pineti]
MNWLHYLLEANLYLAVFYAFYYLFLNKETHYTLNRVYLLLSCIIAFILPVMQIGALKPKDEPVQQTYTTVVQNSYVVQPIVTYEAPVSHFTLQDAVWYAYLLGIVVMALILIIKIGRLIKMTTSANKLVDNKYKLIALQGTNAAFSFFNYLFIGSKTTSSDIIIRHELVHIRQKHSADIVFMELIKIVSWFNPIIYFMQMSLKTVHEYIADEQTAAHETDALTYSSFLVNNAYGLNGVPLSHSFFNYNLLKKRIIMLNQKRSGNLARLKYLAAVPICAGMLCASTLAFSKNYGWVDLAPAHKNAPASFKTASVADTSHTARIKHGDVTNKGYKYEETGYLIDKKTDFRVIIDDKGEHKEYYKSKAKPAELTMLQEKYGYTFPKMLIFPKLPPPPPAPPAPGKHLLKSKLAPPPPPAPPVSEKIPPPPAPPTPQVSEVTPPTPPVEPKKPLDSLYKYIMRMARYPRSAHDNLIGGRVILVLTINNGKIDDVKLARPLYDDIDNEVIRAIKSYNAPLDIKPGAYSLPVSFSLLDEQDKRVEHAPENYKQKNKSNNIQGDPGTLYSLNEIFIVGYATKKL